MKKLTTSIVLLIGTSSLFIACKKNDNADTTGVRLIAIETTLPNGHSRTNIEYNSAGKISRVTNIANNVGPVTVFDVSYNGSEAVLTAPAQNNSSMTMTDTSYFTLDAEGRIQKKVHHNFIEFKAPSNNPQRTFIYDTTVYEYDAAGMLKKETTTGLDTTWFSPPTGVQTTTIRIGTIITYTNSNGNLASINEVSDRSYVTPGGSNLFSHLVTTTNFQYTKKYANKTDFTNAFLLNELNAFFFGVPFNSKYANLPDKSAVTILETDGNGATVQSNTINTDNTVSYNSYGLIASKTSTGAPGAITTYIYNR